MNNPWLDAWREEPDDAALDRIVERRAVSINVHGKNPYELAQLFAASAKEVFLCDAQNRRLLRQILDVGRSHAIRNFLSIEQFELRVQSRSPWTSLMDEAFAITGGAGVGKSAMVEAAGRLMASRHMQISGTNLAGLPLTPMWRARVRDARSIGDLLEQLLNTGADVPGDACSMGKDKGRLRAVSSLRARIRTRSYRDGVAVILVDELQFGARGDACAWITALLLQLLGYGPLLFFVMNFSLAHKLCGRPPEDRRRLISNVIEVRPFERVDHDWIRFLGELLSILPSTWQFDHKDEARDILRFTFGIRDNAVTLLKIALIISRTEDPNGKVTRVHVDQAYRSAAYATRRCDVERLIGSQELLKRRSDLYSPFRARPAANETADDSSRGFGGSSLSEMHPAVDSAESTVVVAGDTVREQAVRVLDAMHFEQLQPDQRKRVENRRKKAQSSAPPAKVVPIRPLKPSSLDDVIGAAAELVLTR